MNEDEIKECLLLLPSALEYIAENPRLKASGIAEKIISTLVKELEVNGILPPLRCKGERKKEGNKNGR
jgi:hypothetical protein